MIRDRAHECMSRDELKQLQADRLVNQVQRVYERVPFYKDLFDKAGIDPQKVRGLDDLPSLPFTRKYHLREQYPFGLFATPLKDVVRIHASSGTTGKPTTVGYTQDDIDMWAEVMARCLAGVGAGNDDIVQVAYGYGLFTGGLGAHYGAERLGASVIPISGSNTQRQLMLMEDFGTTVLCCTPSFALYLWDVAQQLELDVRKFPLKVGVFGAEPWSEAMRQDIEQKWNIKACDIYGLSEIIGPGVSCECVEAQSGLHICDDHFLPEIINPETGEVLPEGEMGELVITTLTKQAFPLIRYRTGDITRLFTEECACGRTNTRMARVSGRSDDMLIIRGVNVFPSQIEEVLTAVDGVEPHYQLVLTKDGRLDSLEIQVEVSPAIFSDEVGRLEQLSQTILERVTGTLGIRVDVKLVEPKSIERSIGKAKRVIDLRKEE